MYFKVIEIKERFLGKDDYEVVLFVGYLVFFYNYDMEKFVEVEKLYLRLIVIGKKLYIFIKFCIFIIYFIYNFCFFLLCLNLMC